MITDWSSLDEVLPILSKYKTGVEILEFAQPENLDDSASLIKNIRQNIAGLPLIGFHGPFSELIPASRDPQVRQVARNRFQQAYDLAQSIGAAHLILHSGFFPKTYPRDQWIQNSYNFWIEFLADKNFPNMIHLENVYEDDYTSLLELVDRINQYFQDERLSICLDIGHVNSNSSKTLRDWITGLGDRIRYTHLHNNGGTLDDHWKLGIGTIDVRHTLELLREYSPAAVWTVETPAEDIEPSLLWLQEQGYLQEI